MDTQPVIDPQSMKAFEVAIDLSKQLITLATGVIALTVTFVKDIIVSVPRPAIPFLKSAWLFFAFSILSGIWSLMAITGTLGRGEAAGGIYQGNITSAFGLQILTFAFATIFVFIFGYRSAIGSIGPAKPKESGDAGI